MRFFTYIILFFCTPVVAQNLVVNNSFEEVTTPYCGWTTIPSQLTGFVNSWNSPTAAYPDVYSTAVAPSCWNYMPNSTYSVTADCVLGSQSPRTGEVMAGLYTFGTNREYLQVPLTQALTVGQVYRISFWVSRADNVGMASDRIGVALSNGAVNFPGIVTLNNLNLAVESETIITESNAWVEITSVFIPNQAYTYLLIGNFKDDASTNTLPQASPTVCQANYAYYYIDDISLTETDPQLIVTAPPVICRGESSTLLAAGADTYEWATLAAPDVVLATTPSFVAMPTTTTTYIVRGMLGNLPLADTLNILVPENVFLPAETTICNGNTLTLNPGIYNDYSWSNNSQTSTITVSEAGSYSVTVTDEYGCVSSVSSTVVLADLPQVSISGASTLCYAAQLPLSATSGFEDYLWNTGATTPTTSVDLPNTYSVTITDSNGCTASAIKSIVMGECPCKVVFPTAFSPNGDGVNDSFSPVASCALQNYQMMVFDRWGNKVFSTQNPDESWDGAVIGKGGEMPLGVYIYTASYAIDTGEIQQQKGNITVIR